MKPATKIPDLEDIRQALQRIGPYIHRTPVLTSTQINDMFEGEFFFKCENFQKAGAFKSRGACNAVFSLDEEDVRRGVCTHSSGNHAAALARAASLRGCPAYIVMPENSSRVKVEAVKSYGGIITFCAPTLAAREETLSRVQEETGAMEIHPYNDFRIIAAQATAAYELFDEVPDLDIIMAPVGGGGLLSGTALAAKYLHENTRVIAGEPQGADDAFRSFTTGTFVPSVNPSTIADGLLTSLGTKTWPIIRQYVDDILTCSDQSIIETMMIIWERMKVVVEPSSAVPLAAAFQNKKFFSGLRTGIIISGGNVDLTKLPWIQNRP